MILQIKSQREITLFQYWAGFLKSHVDTLYRIREPISENMNSDEIIDEVLSASLTQDYTFLQF
jgi:hypothetical protein